MPDSALGAPTPATPRQIVAVIARILLVTALLLVAYFQVPLDRDTTASQLLLFGIGMVGFALILVLQIRRIVNDVTPRLRAVETIGTALPVFVVLFALTYVVLDSSVPESFSEPVSRVTALYFTVTVLATVGFGDVAARTDLARILVTVQMILDLILVGVVAKVIVGASRLGVERRRAEAQAATARMAATATPTDPTPEGSR